MGISVSMVKSTSKTNLNHNNRKLTDREKERNSHIDYSRSDKNEYLIQKDIKKIYEEEFGEALENYNEKQTRSDRKIDNYYEHIEASKKTATQQEMIIQVGDKDDFSSDEKRSRANMVLEAWFDEFQERNPNLKVYNAVIHNDEATPHMHLNFVPVASDYKRGLEKQVSFDRAIKQQDLTLDKTRPFADWREKEVDTLEYCLQLHGFERKLVGTNHYKDVNEYKEKKDLERELSSLDQTLKTKKNEISALNEKINPEFEIKAKYQVRDVDFESEEKTFFGKPKIKTRKEHTGKVVITEPEFKKLMDAARSSEDVKTRTDKLLNTDFGKENKELKAENVSLRNQNNELDNVNVDVFSENHKLKKENDTLKDRISDLKLEVGNLYETTRKFLQESTKDMETFKSVFSSFVNKVKEKIPGSEFLRVHERSKEKETEFNMSHVKDLDESLKGKKSPKKNKDMDMEI